jgi:hypothetical protein
MRDLQKALAVLLLIVMVAEFVGCAASAEPRGRKRSGNTTAQKK